MNMNGPPTAQLTQSKLAVFALIVLLAAGCTTTPDRYKKKSFSQNLTSPLKADNSKMQALATAVVGQPQQFVDRQSGLTSELTVESEYFSANGRNCRRFTESGRGRAGVGCLDDKAGWVELPLDKLLR